MPEEAPLPESRPQQSQKIYFGAEEPQRDKNLNARGWTLAGDDFKDEKIIPMQRPEGTVTFTLEPDHTPYGESQVYLVLDPDKAEARVVKRDHKGASDEQETLIRMGWQEIDANVARAIYARTKPQQNTSQ